MTNADFWNQINSIIKDGFSSEGLQKLDHYAELFINGRLVYKRFSPAEQYGCAEKLQQIKEFRKNSSSNKKSNEK